MIKKYYIVPAVKVHKLEVLAIMAASDPDNPDWEVIPSDGTPDGSPSYDPNQDNDETGEDDGR